MLQDSNRLQGYTLMELLIALCVLAILLTLAGPSMIALMHKTRVQATAQLFVTHYQLARNTAISTRTATIFCPIDTGQANLVGQKCGQDWHKGAAVFKDKNGNLIIDDEAEIEAFMQPTKNGIQLKMRAALNKQYLRFMPNGFLENTAGSMIICSSDNNPQHGKIIIFSRNGRIRFGMDKNKDGIPENAEGQPISCPP